MPSAGHICFALQMQEVDTAWALFKGLKASGMEPADYPPVNDWLAKRAIAGISKPSNTQDMVRAPSALEWSCCYT